MPVKVKNLKFEYNKKMPNAVVAIDNVSFDVDSGEIVGIIGHTGSGKTSLVQCLNGLIKPDEGEIVLDEIEITNPNTKVIDIRGEIGIVFQYPEYQLFEETVEKDVAFGPTNLQLDDEEINKRVRNSLEMVGFDYDKIKDISPFDLSGGEKRKVAIAGVIAMEPKVLILDEPTAGLDPKAHVEILQMLMDIHNKLNNTIFLVSHDMADVAKMCDKILVMNRGKLVASGSPKEIFAQNDLLNEIGLDVPSITEFIVELDEKGFNIKRDILDINTLATEIVKELQC